MSSPIRIRRSTWPSSEEHKPKLGRILRVHSSWEISPRVQKPGGWESTPLSIPVTAGSIRAQGVFVWCAISCDNQRVFQTRPLHEFPIPFKFRDRLPAVLRAFQDTIGAPEEQGVRQLRVRTLLENVVRAQSHIESFTLAGTLHPHRSVGVHSRCAHLAQMLKKTAEISLLHDGFRFPSVMQ